MIPDHRIRPLIQADIPRLVEINPTFTAQTVIQITRTGVAPFWGWQLAEVPRSKIFDKKHAYDFDPIEQQNIQERLQAGNCLIDVVENSSQGRLVGILDIALERWRRTAWLWNLMIDVNSRGKGWGQILVHRAIEWAKSQQLRAILLETQSNNPQACHFYAHMGFQLVGVNDVFYTNQDMEDQEVALFWSYALE